MNTELSVFVHIVTFNNEETIEKVLSVLLTDSHDVSITIRITDNSSSDRTCELIEQGFASRVKLIKSPVNLGFSAGHNSALKDFFESGCEYFLCLNPDLSLPLDSLGILLRTLEQEQQYGAACPKLLRADWSLEPVSPARFDSAGMMIAKSLRHFDRGSEELDQGQFDAGMEVFGASGACCLMRRAFIKRLCFRADHDQDLFHVYPELESGSQERLQLFDEAFFAYREDADLAWRAQLLGQRYLYCPEAVGFHQRKVLPERRAALPATLNFLGVRNRFLLQLNNYSPVYNPEAVLSGLLFRNVIVGLAVVLVEQTSLKAFRDIFLLARRAFARRKWVYSQSKDPRRMRRWFKE